MRVRKRYGLREKDFKKVTSGFVETFGMTLDGSRFEEAETDGPTMYLLDGVPIGFELDGELYPSIAGIMKFNATEKAVTVDMGAVRFLANGANVMAPGIVDADPSIKKGDTVWVREESHGRPLTVGKATQDGPDMVKGTGVAIETVHFVGDKIWKLFE